MRAIFRLKTYFATQKHFIDNHFANARAISNDRPGDLAQLCSVFTQNGVNLSYLRTHFQNIKKKNPQKSYQIDFSFAKKDGFNFQKAKSQLLGKGIKIDQTQLIKVPWFPRNYQQLDKIGHTLLDVNEAKQGPQFTDVFYRKRRDQIANIALNYKMGQSIPDVAYTPQQQALWINIYKKLNNMHKKSMSSRFNQLSLQLNKDLGLDRKIPQQRQISSYLQSKTGFKLKPVHGILSQREFLNCFAFRVFCCTQYLRNVKSADYTPEPDIVHEYVGHIPLFADPQIADISQKIGLLSLGASDQQIAKLGTIYWYTLQFGVCIQASGFKGYGAGIASSIGQINHLDSSKALFKKLDIFSDAFSSYKVQSVQQLYRVTQTFEKSLEDLERYGQGIMKPITTVYNQLTDQIQYDRGIEGVFTEDKGPKF